ncbi:hypothetical protein UFOVP9_19 [uncultured Caudovirales phage]|jgi:hypothetical protein|uniref:Uncharacterized protein n=1 Tax=uncultured Caudovirales phage TaxID=2100421 RepID=A0A6J5KJ42_9CAUD|nr:hypothetical protein UFOVP9_19 [uncultured Caudovirales phage]
MEPRNIIFRRSAPNYMDHAGRGTVCIVKGSDDFEIYVQVRFEDSHPDWQYIGFTALDANQDEIDILINAIPLYDHA